MRTFGTDALRLYLYQTNAMLIGDLSFDEDGIQDAYQQIILPYWNACNFFISYANIDGFERGNLVEPYSNNQLDKWILAQLYNAEKKISENMDAYYVNKYVVNLIPLVNGLTNWYIRRSRRRFWASGMSDDKLSAYQTLYYVLVNMTKLFAPIAPIISETVFQTLMETESVHLEDWPVIPSEYCNEELLERVDLVQDVISLARSIRNKNGVKNRQPLMTLNVAFSDISKIKLIKEFEYVIMEELNVKNIVVLDTVDEIATIKYDPNFNEIKSLYPDKVKDLIKAIKSGTFEMHEDSVSVEIDGVTSSYNSSIVLNKIHL